MSPRKAAFITGAGSGIGRAIAVTFAREGWRVALFGRRADALGQTAACLGAPEGNVLLLSGSVADRAVLKPAVDRAAGEFGGLHILVNNAGINTRRRNLGDISDEDWDLVLETNLTGAFNGFRAALPHFQAQSDGLVINISSMAGKRAGTVGGAAYSASKFGMASLTQSINAEFRDAGIRACCIYPGEVDTPILDHRPVAVSAEKRKAALRPEDVAAAALMVARLPDRVVVEEITIFPRRAVAR